jgi:Xaa-Pro aminopeptidase
MRITGLKKRLAENQVDAYLITNVKNVYYFTGFMDIAGAELSLLVPVDDVPILLTPPLSFIAAREKASDCLVEEVPVGDEPLNRLVTELKNQQIHVVGFDDLSIAWYLRLTQELEFTRFTQKQSMVWGLRRVKDEEEIHFMKKAAELTDAGATVGMEFVGDGVREYEVAAEIEYEMRRRGSEGVAFETIVASGPRSAYPHGLSTDRIIKRGDSVVMDLGAVYRGYRSDITRTVIVGKPSPNQVRVLNLVMAAQEEAFKAIRDGVNARDIDALARNIIEAEGYGRYFIHGLGHGVGLDIHEPPRLSHQSTDCLKAGNVVTDEPGIYLPGFGARIEDTVLVRGKNGERLTRANYFEG